MVAPIAILAFAMLRVAQALNGMALYAAAFGLALASGIVGTVSGGRWSDRAGPVVVLQAGVAAFLVGLVGAAIATQMVAVVAARALQGFGGGMISVTLYVVVARVYTPALRPRVFSGFAAAWVLPAMVGPVLAGWMAETVGWRWVFFSAALLAVPATILLRLGLRPHLALLGGTGQEGPPPTDRAWILTPAVAASATLLYGAASGAQPAVWLSMGLLGLGMLAPRLLPQGTFRAREGLPTIVLLRGLVAAAFFCGEVLLPLLLVQQRGFSSVEAGLVLTAGVLGWSAGSWFQGGHPVAGPARSRRLRRGIWPSESAPSAWSSRRCRC